MSKSRNWCFTRQATQGEVSAWASTAAAVIPEPFHWHEDRRVKFVLYQIEKAPTTGQIHVQGMISFKGNTKMSTVKALIENNPHCEPAKDVNKCYDYCKKAESRVYGPWEHGERPVGQGKRTDLKKVYTDLKAHKRTREMLEEDPCVAKFEKQIKFMRFNIQEGDSDRQLRGVKTYVFYGPTDMGKTYTAMNLMDPGNVFKMDPPATKGQMLWWDAYEGERTLLMDEFEGENYCALNKLKVLLDVYKCRLDVKGAFTWAAWTTVIICSNTPPCHWYSVAPTEQHMLEPLKRRIYQIRRFVAKGVYIIEDWDRNALSDQLTVLPPDTQPIMPSPLPVPQQLTAAAPPQDEEPTLDLFPSDITLFSQDE